MEQQTTQEEKECKWCGKGNFCIPFLYHPIDREGNVIDSEGGFEE